MTVPQVVGERAVGRGRIAQVTLGREPQLGRLVAVKRLLPPGDRHLPAVDALLRRLAAGARHRSLLGILGHAVDADGWPTLVTDVGAGGDLQTRLADGDRWTVLESLLAVAGIAEGVAVLHDADLVHGDIRAPNVLLDRWDGPLLADAGLEPLWRTAVGADPTQVPAGIMAGMAPEVLSGGPLTTAADVHALGGLLHVLLCGRPPRMRSGMTREDVLQQVVDGVLEDLRPAGLPETAWQVLRSALDPEPAARPTARGLAGALAAVARSLVTAPADAPTSLDVEWELVDARHVPDAPLPPPLPVPATSEVRRAREDAARSPSLETIRIDVQLPVPDEVAPAPGEVAPAPVPRPGDRSAPPSPFPDGPFPDGPFPDGPFPDGPFPDGPFPDARTAFDLPPPGPAGPSRRPGRRRGLVVAGTAGLLLLVVGGATLLSVRSPGTDLATTPAGTASPQDGDAAGEVGPATPTVAPGVGGTPPTSSTHPGDVATAPTSPPSPAPTATPRIPHDGPEVPPPPGVRVVAGRGLEVGGPAEELSLARPEGIAVLPDGAVLVADRAAHRVYRIDVDGTATVFAGSGHPARDGDLGPADEASLHEPYGLAVHDGAVYVTDRGNGLVRRITPDGRIATVAGGRDSLLSPDRPPHAIAVGTDGTVYVTVLADGLVVAVAPDGREEVIAGTGTRGSTGDGGPAAEATLDVPTGIAVDGDGLLVVELGRAPVADAGPTGRVRRLSRDGADWRIDAVPGADGLDRPEGLAVRDDGTLLVADTFANRIVRIAGGQATTVAGTGDPGSRGDGGPATAGALDRPKAVAVTADGALLIGEGGTAVVRRAGPDGILSTLAGRRPTPGAQPAAALSLTLPTAAAVLPGGGVVVTDVATGDLHEVVGGTATNRTEGVTALTSPGGVAVDDTGTTYVADTQTHVVYALDRAGSLRVVAGQPNLRPAELSPEVIGEGVPATEALLWAPRGLAWHDGVLYIADSLTHRVRAVGPDGLVRTVAGSVRGHADGPGGTPTAPGARRPSTRPSTSRSPADGSSWPTRSTTSCVPSTCPPVRSPPSSARRGSPTTRGVTVLPRRCC